MRCQPSPRLPKAKDTANIFPYRRPEGTQKVMCSPNPRPVPSEMQVLSSKIPVNKKIRGYQRWTNSRVPPNPNGTRKPKNSHNRQQYEKKKQVNQLHPPQPFARYFSTNKTAMSLPTSPKIFAHVRPAPPKDQNTQVAREKTPPTRPKQTAEEGKKTVPDPRPLYMSIFFSLYGLVKTRETVMTFFIVRLKSRRFPVTTRRKRDDAQPKMLYGIEKNQKVKTAENSVVRHRCKKMKLAC
ncbi:hypothetical protein B0T21DRAFT_119640 [Apiosordaria backusii]|uniref:Uncharacterized protein n=1 Tax=Apiosordaria backusii TaxID=314023 RepID=A0AA40ELW7_9PEZI|nr:hypothetical protein B0T21DRAFT_119640 [Apiosordaria backusii]